MSTKVLLSIINKILRYDPKKLVASSEKLNLRREVDSNTMILSNGRYAIIPCTKKPGEYAEFSINIYYNCKHNEIAVTKVYFVVILIYFSMEILNSNSM